MAVTMVIGNRPEIAKSLFAPGYTMASVLANEFSEATGDVYLSALVEIGLALFLVTIIVNALAQLLVWTCNPRPACEGTCLNCSASSSVATSAWRRISWRRRMTDHLMTGVAILTVVLVLAPLVAIFGYLVYRGVGSINWAFLTQTPKPVGEAGGGMANAIVGIDVDPRNRQRHRRALRHRRRYLSGRVWTQSLRRRDSLHRGRAERSALDRDRHRGLGHPGSRSRFLRACGRRGAGDHDGPDHHAAPPKKCCCWCRRRCAKRRMDWAFRAGERRFRSPCAPRLPA